MTTSGPRRRLLSSTTRLITTASSGASRGTARRNRRVVADAEESVQSQFGSLRRSSEIERANVSRHWIHAIRRAEGLPALGNSRAGFRGAVTAVSLAREQAPANSDPCPERSSPTSEVLGPKCYPPFGIGATSWQRIERLSGDDCDGIGRTSVNDGLKFFQNSFSSPKLRNSHYERTDVSVTDLSRSSVLQELALSGPARPYEHVFAPRWGLQGRLYSSAGERVRPVSEKHGDERSKTDGGGRLVGKEAGEKTWIQVVFPERLWPYAQLARLDKPIGTWLLAWPCFWSICLAAPSGSLPDLEILGLFGVGAVLLRGAGCTVNDLLDSDIDGKVERTQQRPIASGALTPFQGLSFLGFQLLLGLGILLQLNDFSKILGASSLLLVGTYPLMKRWTFWPQAYLGLTFNWGALLGWAAVHGALDLSVVLPLYASGVCWTLVYDTIYAHQDKEDDMKVGVKSTALRFGNATKPWLAVFGTGCVTCLTLAGFNCDLGWPFYAGMAATAGHIAWQVSTVEIHNRVDCNSKFVSNKWLGAIVCSSIVFGKLAESSI